MKMDSVTSKLMEILQERLGLLGLDVSDVDANDNLVANGVLDSFSFLEFIASIEDAFSIELDLGDMDPSEFSSVNGLVSIITKLNGATA